MSDTFDESDLWNPRDFLREGDRCNDCKKGTMKLSKKGKLYCDLICWKKEEKKGNYGQRNQILAQNSNMTTKLLKALLKLRHAFYVEGDSKSLKTAFEETHDLIKIARERAERREVES